MVVYENCRSVDGKSLLLPGNSERPVAVNGSRQYMQGNHVGVIRVLSQFSFLLSFRYYRVGGTLKVRFNQYDQSNQFNQSD